MINDLKALAIFAETAKHGSFRRAAKNLSLSPSVVSYHIAQLEKKLEIPLLYRSTRKISLTHEGKILLHHATAMLEAAQHGIHLLRVEDGALKGNLSITLPSALTRSPLNSRIADFCKSHPDIFLKLNYTDNRLDLVADGIDVAIRAGELSDSSLKAKRIGSVRRKLVCSRNFLTQHDIPTHPRNIKNWKWIWFELMPKHRTLFSANGESYTVTYNSTISVDSVEAMAELCCQGLGLATPPDYLVDESIAKGILVELLPDWRLEDVAVYALWHANLHANVNTRAFLDFIQEKKQ